MYKNGSTALIEGAGTLMAREEGEEKYVIRSFDDKHFVLGIRYTNHIDLYAFSQYETEVLPTLAYAYWKHQFPNVVTEKPAPKKKDRVFE
jgi:hypothetical protein